MLPTDARSAAPTRRLTTRLLCVGGISAAALGGGLAAARPAAAVSPDIVISEVYGGGGNSGSTYTNDFIELYNRGSAAVDVGTWSVQYNSATGTSPYQLTKLTGSISAGAHYLVQESQGGGGTTPLPAADATGTIALSATAGRVALVTGQTALAAGSASNASGIRDFVGFGATAATSETAPAPAPGNTTSINRSATGSDTDDNSADFTTAAPSPQGSSAGGGTPTAQALKIDQIQGPGMLSPYVGIKVTFQGVVTGVEPLDGAYFVEDPTPDANPLTSEGIYVYGAGTLPATGQSVTVTGTVAEYRSSADDLSLTEITGSAFSVLPTALPALPAPVVIGPGALQAPAQAVDADYPDNGYDPSAAHTDIETDGHPLNPARNAADFYETIEGMRVTLTGAVAVGPDTPPYGELPVLPADATGNPGTGTAATYRGGALYTGYDTPNTRRVTLDDEIYRTSTTGTPLVNVGAVLGGNLSGIMTYATFGGPFLELSSAPTVVSNPLLRANAAPAGAGDFSIGSLNLENLWPGDPATKFSSLAAQVVTALGAPDVVNVQEVQDNDGAPDETGGKDDGVVDASQTYAKLIAAISAAGGPSYSYVQINPVNDQDGGDPGGNIRQGLLYRTDTGLTLAAAPAGDSTTADSVVAGSDGAPHLALNPGRVMPGDTAAWSASRKPLAVELVRNGRSFFVIDNHFISKGGDSPLFGRIQPPTRTSETQRVAQADDVNAFVRSLLAADANADVAVVGDLNDYSFSPALTALKSGGVLTDLITQLPANQQYNYVFQGNSQQLDHTLVSPHLAAAANPRLSVARQNSEFADQVSDHEPEVARLALGAAAGPPASLPEAPVALLVPLAGLGALAGALGLRRRRRNAAV